MDSLTTQAYSTSTMAEFALTEQLNQCRYSRSCKPELVEAQGFATENWVMSQGWVPATQVQSNASNINQNTNNIAGNSGSINALMHAC